MWVFRVVGRGLTHTEPGNRITANSRGGKCIAVDDCLGATPQHRVAVPRCGISANLRGNSRKLESEKRETAICCRLARTPSHTGRRNSEEAYSSRSRRPTNHMNECYRGHRQYHPKIARAAAPPAPLPLCTTDGRQKLRRGWMRRRRQRCGRRRRRRQATKRHPILN